MNRIKSFPGILLAVLLMAVSGLNAQEYTPKQILFKTTNSLEIQRGRTGITAFDAYLDDIQALSVSPIKGMKDNRWFSANLAVEPDWNTLRNNPPAFEGIDIIQPNYLNKLLVIPNDPWYSLQQLNLVKLPQAWNYTTGSSMVVVAVIDSGMLTDHPDLQGNIYTNPLEIPNNGIDDDNNGYIDDYMGWDFVDAPELVDIALGDYTGQDNDVTDENFHGTHVAGIIGAVSNNGIGISGVCWNIKLLPIRAGFRTTSGSGYLQDDDAAAAIIYAADMGASVMNLSWGDVVYSAIIADACNYAYTHGVSIVASAGNQPGPNLNYPAKLASTISVGAVDPYKTLAGFSSYGPELDLVAPGQQIYSTYKSSGPDMYKELSGTSMSAPFVTGAIALLKSIRPNLTPDEVRACLLSSTDDLGPNGFDIQYGHGLLNVRKLLENLSSPYIRVSYPADYIGVSQDFDILGTVSGETFFRYSVMCSLESDTGSMDWKDVFENTTSPHFVYEPVVDGVLARFRIHELMPEGTYIIRIQFEATDGSIYNLFRSIVLDMSAPYVEENTFQVYKRYDGQNVKYFASADFNEPVRSELTITDSDMNQYTVFPSVMDTLQVWQFPVNISPGEVDVQITAVNHSTLSFTSALMSHVIDVEYEIVSSYGYQSREIGNPMIPLNRFYDFDNNTVPEFVAMELPSGGYGDVKVFELIDTVLIQKYQFAQKFMPLDIGNTNAFGQELLTLNLDTSTLFETGTALNYPTMNLWSKSGVSGGIIADYDNDGTKDFLLVRNLAQERVIQLYKRVNDTTVSDSLITLRNTTQTFTKNTFVPTLICTNLDNDIKPDILTADTDGDVMIFEATAPGGPAMTWTRRLPVTNAYYLTTGDYNNNGIKDFFVGGYNTSVQDPNQNYWYFEGFSRTGDNQFASMGSIRFNNVMSQNAIQSQDLDGDGSDEIILALAPNLYVVKYINGRFQPVFYGNSIRTFQIAAWTQDGQSRFITNGIASDDSVKAFVWTLQTPFTGPPTPANLVALPLNASHVSLSWQPTEGYFYRIYRMVEGYIAQIIAEQPATAYTDTTVVEGTAYSYAVTAVDYAFNPVESLPTLWVTTVPMTPPQITEINMTEANEAQIVFDQPLASSALNPSCYSVSHAMGTPLSANSILNQHGILLRFRNLFPETDESFTLTMHNVFSAAGVAPLQNTYDFTFNPDYTPPYIEGAIVLADNRSVCITISETVQQISALDEANYELILPANDNANSIQSIAVDDNLVTVTLTDRLKYSNRFYYLVLRNITDLAGNVIAPNRNSCRFYLYDIKNLDKIVVYPNPVKSGEYDALNFMNFPRDKKGKLAIYTLSGDLVFNTSIGPFNPDNNNVTFTWDLHNQSGKQVSSGIYYYVINMGGETKRGKIAVLN
jgi:subtilisin family serine protease